ncbi:MAG: polyprenyl synthetase family protein [Prevotellaceae bacterium]|jgi:geranylgeranyl diphosphate synthase type II|nr:polyprenyl synthetase family protein [Prevotellaceae bacterium]
MYSLNQLLQHINTHIAGLTFRHFPDGLYAPIEYVLSLPSKRVRPALLLMAYNLYKDELAAAYPQAVAIEIFHNFTLLHDDLMDRSSLRRGKPTVHRVWNDNTAILSGDAMLVLAYRYLLTGCPPQKLAQVTTLFNKMALEVCEGQQLDMEFERRNNVTVDEYLEMIRLKTAVLLAGSLQMGAILADAPEGDAELLYHFGINIGLAFQLEDDLLDVYGNPTTFGKNIGGDILCNKKTFLLLKALQHADDEQRRELQRWLATEPTLEEEKIKAVVTLYNNIGVRQICEQAIQAYIETAATSLQQLSVPAERLIELEQINKRLARRQV